MHAGHVAAARGLFDGAQAIYEELGRDLPSSRCPWGSKPRFASDSAGTIDRGYPSSTSGRSPCALPYQRQRDRDDGSKDLEMLVLRHQHGCVDMPAAGRPDVWG